MVKDSPAPQQPQETWVPSLASGGSPGGGHENPRQYSYLENPVDREASWAMFQGVTKSRTRWEWLSRHARTCLQTCLPVMLLRESLVTMVYRMKSVSNKGVRPIKREERGDLATVRPLSQPWVWSAAEQPTPDISLPHIQHHTDSCWVWTSAPDDQKWVSAF